MGSVVSSTADILAILGGATTLVLGVFGAIRLSRCQNVRCCWGCIDLVNKPIAASTDTALASTKSAQPSPPLRASSSETDLAAASAV
jgi:hypothetical protein